MRTGATICGAILLIAPLQSTAGVPSAVHCTLPSGIQLVGTSSGVPDVKGQAQVVVRDASSNPVANATVTIDFAPFELNAPTCAGSDLHLCNTQPFGGNSIVCTSTEKTVSAYTNASGVATFRIVGSTAVSPGNPPGVTQACARVRIGTYILGHLRVGAYDLNNSGGVNSADQSLFLEVMFASPAGYRSRADYNGDGFCNSADYSKFISVMFGAGSNNSCQSGNNCF